jgi:hypothetical protein
MSETPYEQVIEYPYYGSHAEYQKAIVFKCNALRSPSVTGFLTGEELMELHKIMANELIVQLKVMIETFESQKDLLQNSIKPGEPGVQAPPQTKSLHQAAIASSGPPDRPTDRTMVLHTTLEAKPGVFVPICATCAESGKKQELSAKDIEYSVKYHNPLAMCYHCGMQWSGTRGNDAERKRWLERFDDIYDERVKNALYQWKGA